MLRQVMACSSAAVGAPGHLLHRLSVERKGLVVPAQGRAGQRHVVVQPAQQRGVRWRAAS